MTEEIDRTEEESDEILKFIIYEEGLGENIHIGLWGNRRLEYLKNHKRNTYTEMLASGHLLRHLQEIDITAYNRWELGIQQMMKSEGVTEQLKRENQMLWVGKANNIRACVEELIWHELIYN